MGNIPICDRLSQKIKPNVSVVDFRKFAPRVLKTPVPVDRSRAVVMQARPIISQVRPNQPTPIQSFPRGKPKPVIKTPVPVPVPVPVQRPAPRLINEVRNEIVRVSKIVKPYQNQDRPKVNTQQILSSNSKLKNIGVGRILVMIAAGPSVGEVDFSPIKDHPLIDVMCINKPYQGLWPTKFWAFCDETQRLRNIDIWNQYGGIILNSTNVKASKPNQYVFRSKHGKGFELDVSDGYHIGRSSTYANMQVANYMGYNKIYIFGLDMSDKDGQLHYYGQNPDVSNDTRKGRFLAEAEHYTFAAQHLSKGIRDKFVICSSINPWEFTKHFSKIDHKGAIQAILESLRE